MPHTQACFFHTDKSPLELSCADGEDGLPKNQRGAYLVKPNQEVFVDLLMFEFDKCDPILRPPGSKTGIVEFAHLGKQSSLICERGKP